LEVEDVGNDPRRPWSDRTQAGGTYLQISIGVFTLAG